MHCVSGVAISVAASVIISLCLASCAHKPAPEPVAIQEPMVWPQQPLLPCRARVHFARQFLGSFKQGLPEQRIVIAEDWEPAEERAEILEIRRRAYHDQDALSEVVACAMGRAT